MHPLELSKVSDVIARSLLIISKHVKEDKVFGSCQQWDDWFGEWRESSVDVVYLDFSNPFNTVPINILTGKLLKYGLDQWTMR